MNGTCDSLDPGQLEALAITRSSIALLSYVVTAFTIVTAIGFYGAHRFFSQRLVLYSLTAALILSGIRVVQIVERVLEELCVPLAFLEEYVLWVKIAFTCWITFYLFTLTVCSCNPSQKCQEIVYVSVSVLLPLPFACVPFVTNSYGLAGAWCWIRGVNNDSNCTSHPLGIAFQFGLWYVPLYSIIIIGAIIYIKMVRHLYKNRYTGKYDHMGPTRREQLMKEVIPFLIFPWVFLVIVTLPAVYRVLDLIFTTDKIMTLSIISAAITPFSGTIAAILFGLDIETVSRLCHLSTYTMCCVKKKVVEYDAHPTMSDSYVEDDETKLETGYVIINVN